MFRNPRQTGWWIVAAAAIGLFSSSTANAKKPPKPPSDDTLEYDIHQLDSAGGAFTGSAADINDLREVVGTVRTPTGEDAAAHWNVVEVDGVVESSLSILSGGVAANAINNLGEIVGQKHDASGNAVAVYWPTPASAAIELPLLPGYDVSLPMSINNNGLICGYMSVSGQQDWQSDIAVVWRVTLSNGVPVISDPVDLPGGRDGGAAAAVNDNDESGVAQVVGAQHSTWTPLLWEVQSLPDGTLSVSANPQVIDDDVAAFALGINNSGLICGRTEFDAVVWSSGESSFLDRPGKGKNKVPRAWARDISDNGIIVGDAGEYYDPRACFWDGITGSLTYLDDYLEPDSPLLGLSRAEAVNAFGDIVGDGWNDAFIAVPK